MDPLSQLEHPGEHKDDIERLKADVASGVEKVRDLALADTFDMKQHLMSGDIQKAVEVHSGMSNRLQCLAFAEHNLAAIGAGEVRAVRDLQAGDNVRGFGKVISKDLKTEPCRSGRHTHEWVTILFEGDEEETQMDPSDRVVLLRTEGDSPQGE